MQIPPSPAWLLSPAFKSFASRIGRSAALILLLLFYGFEVATGAETPRIDVAVGANEIFVGESIDFQVEIKNVENPQKPEVSSLQEIFDVVFAGDHSRNQSSTFIINGSISQKNEFSHVYLYRLTPKNAGQLTIPPIKMTVDGKDYFSQSINLFVREEEKQDLVLVEVLSDHEKSLPYSVIHRDGANPCKAIARARCRSAQAFAKTTTQSSSQLVRNPSRVNFDRSLKLAATTSI